MFVAAVRVSGTNNLLLTPLLQGMTVRHKVSEKN